MTIVLPLCSMARKYLRNSLLIFHCFVARLRESTGAFPHTQFEQVAFLLQQIERLGFLLPGGVQILEQDDDRRGGCQGAGGKHHKLLTPASGE